MRDTQGGGRETGWTLMPSWPDTVSRPWESPSPLSVSPSSILTACLSPRGRGSVTCPDGGDAGEEILSQSTCPASLLGFLGRRNQSWQGLFRDLCWHQQGQELAPRPDSPGPGGRPVGSQLFQVDQMSLPCGLLYESGSGAPGMERRTRGLTLPLTQTLQEPCPQPDDLRGGWDLRWFLAQPPHLTEKEALPGKMPIRVC